jgi:tRNA(fMet)-specific endonuclease VapC
MKYLLDTNICIYIIKKKPKKVKEHFSTLQVGEVAISTITQSELQYGVEKSSNTEKNQRALDQFLLPLAILEYDQNASREYGKIRSDLEKRGQPIGPLDLLIAAHAKSLDLILVTNNTKEFSKISGLIIENWI